MVSKIRILSIGEVAETIVITGIQRALISIVSIDVANMLLLDLNNGRHKMDVDIQ